MILIVKKHRRENMKSGSHFHFKLFSVAHDKSTHKVGTDGVLLGAWVNLQHAQRILDIGSGTGVIALMFAQRTSGSAYIDAVEIEKADATQAAENIKRSPWPEKIKMYHSAIQDFSPSGKYDLIVSNPPYFINSWLPPGKKRSQARHAHQLTYDELLEFSARHLDAEGRLAVILPAQEGLLFIAQSARYGLFCIRQWAFRSRSHKAIERYLLEFSPKVGPKEEGKINLYSESDEWSEEYVKLTREFYLKI
jgi:tRNA1Val (adenine37-N6)-methyltransferase